MEIVINMDEVEMKTARSSGAGEKDKDRDRNRDRNRGRVEDRMGEIYNSHGLKMIT